jgi:hypothetical protein
MSFDSPTKKSSNTNRGDAFVDGAPDGAAADALDDRERHVPAVERQERQQVQQRERKADDREHLEVLAPAELDGLARLLDDADRGRHVLPPRPAGDVA